MADPRRLYDLWAVPVADAVKRYNELTWRAQACRTIAVSNAAGRPSGLDPEDFPPLTADEHLEVLALGEHITRHYRHPAHVHRAILAGATWRQIADATGSTAGEARRAYREWADGQHQLGGKFGLSDDEYAAAVRRAEDDG